MRLDVRQYTISSPPKKVLSVPLDQLHNFNLHGVGAFEVGTAGFAVGDGEPVSAGGNWGFTFRDFRSRRDAVLEVYAGAPSETTLTVTCWRD